MKNLFFLFLIKNFHPFECIVRNFMYLCKIIIIEK